MVACSTAWDKNEQCFRIFFFFLNIGLDFDIKFVSLRVSSLVAITKDFIEGNYLNHKVAGISLLSIILNISDDGTSVKEKI